MRVTTEYFDIQRYYIDKNPLVDLKDIDVIHSIPAGTAQKIFDSCKDDLVDYHEIKADTGINLIAIGLADYLYMVLYITTEDPNVEFHHKIMTTMMYQFFLVNNKEVYDEMLDIYIKENKKLQKIIDDIKGDPIEDADAWVKSMYKKCEMIQQYKIDQGRSDFTFNGALNLIANKAAARRNCTLCYLQKKYNEKYKGRKSKRLLDLFIYDEELKQAFEDEANRYLINNNVLSV